MQIPQQDTPPGSAAQTPAADPDGAPGKPDVGTIHKQLRERILAGHIPAGTVLSQVQLAESFGVSRTPLREALRMLQEEGLIQAESNRRARVATFQLEDLAAIAAQRIMLSALSTYITVPHLDEADLARLTDAHQAMARATDAGDVAAWRAADAAFHAAHYCRAPARLHQEVTRLAERNDLYRSVWLRDAPHQDQQTVIEHERILNACRERNVQEATHGIARHQARIAITVMTHAVPEREPTTIRAALQLVLGLGFSSSDRT